MKVSHAQKQDRKRGRRPRIAVDMDEVIADSLSHHLYRYNQETGQKLTPETIRLKGLKSAISGEDLALFYRLPHEAGFFADLAVIEGSQHALKTLSAEYDIFITSAAMEVPPSFDDKFKWLQRHFPFIPTSRIVFCGDKGIIDADYLVDDRSRHFAGFRGTGILFTAPHNAQENSPLRANNWDEVLAILQKEQPEVQLSAPGNFVKAEAEGLA
jgi:5'(3')-deoxyribonucleotidase